MTTNIPKQTPFLRAQRTFPQQAPDLVQEIDLAYVDIANAVNARTIGLFANSQTIATGESWYVANNRKQQSQRQVFVFTAAGAFNHNIGNALQTVSPNSYGQATDGTNWFGVIFGSSVAIAGQYSFFVNKTQITVLAGAGVPAITGGFIVLEWLTNV